MHLQDWETQLMIERSTAMKCPSVNYQLTGTKKIQQVRTHVTEGHMTLMIVCVNIALYIYTRFCVMFPMWLLATRAIMSYTFSIEIYEIIVHIFIPILAKPGVIERYIKDLNVVNDIRKTFVGQFSLDLVRF